MITIIDKNSGQLLYASTGEVDLKDNEIGIDKLLNEHFAKPYYNFKTMEFYEGATEIEIEQMTFIIEPTKEDLILKVQLLEEQLLEVKNQLNTL
jgi:hypothetical protein